MRNHTWKGSMLAAVCTRCGAGRHKKKFRINKRSDLTGPRVTQHVGYSYSMHWLYTAPDGSETRQRPPCTGAALDGWEKYDFPGDIPDGVYLCLVADNMYHFKPKFRYAIRQHKAGVFVPETPHEVIEAFQRTPLPLESVLLKYINE